MRTKAHFLFGASLFACPDDWTTDPKTHHGMPSTLEEIAEDRVSIKSGTDGDGEFDEITVPDTFEPGSIMLFSTDMAVSFSRPSITHAHCSQGMTHDLDAECSRGAHDAVKDLDLIDLNVCLFRSDGEERDATGEPRGVNL